MSTLYKHTVTVKLLEQTTFIIVCLILFRFIEVLSFKIYKCTQFKSKKKKTKLKILFGIHVKLNGPITANHVRCKQLK